MSFPPFFRLNLLKWGMAIPSLLLLGWIANGSDRPIDQEKPSIVSTKKVEVFFGPKAADDPKGLYLNLLRFLNTAEKSIQGSVHEIDMVPIAELLARKADAGIEVTLYVESQWWSIEKNTAATKILKASKVHIIPDAKTTGLMHDKFLIIDGKRVWTGSTNLTETCLFYNPNNALWIEQPKVAAIYAKKFQNQISGSEVIPKSSSSRIRRTSKPDHPTDRSLQTVALERHGDSLKVLFTPDDDPLPDVIQLIEEAKTDIDVMCFVFSSKEISQALLQAQKRGVKIRVLFDNSFETDEATSHWKTVPFKDLTDAGISCKYDSSKAKLHHKLIVVDQIKVLTGSMNLSSLGAYENEENSLIIEAQEVAQLYHTEFERLWDRKPQEVIASPQPEKALVIHPLTGDRLLVLRNGASSPVTVRLIGVDAPIKATRDRAGQEPWGTKSQQFLTLLCTQKEVRIETDLVEQTPSGEILAYVWLGEKMLNEEILKAGEGMVVTKPPNVKYAERLLKAQQEAREKACGLWNPKDLLVEKPGDFMTRIYRAADELRLKEKRLSLKEWSPDCIIGNRNSKKYHKPDSRYYASAKTSSHAIFFKTEHDAKEAGYHE